VGRVSWLSLIVFLSVPAARIRAAAQGDKASPMGKGGVGDKIEETFRFEIVSIRPLPGFPGSMNTRPSPNGFTSGLNFYWLLDIAYAPSAFGLNATAYWPSYRILNAPTWFGDYYQIDARVSQADLKAWQSQSRDHELLRSALRAALKDRCKLATHEQESKEEIYELTVGKRGPRLKPTPPNSVLPIGIKWASGGVAVSNTVNGKLVLEWHAATMGDLAEYLSGVKPNFPVRDRTGLTGHYDFTLREEEISPDDDRINQFPVDPLGLQLKRGTEIRPGLVIDHVERPTPN
jgi:uncharacterized protein (TIGR03435 family)